MTAGTGIKTGVIERHAAEAKGEDGKVRLLGRPLAQTNVRRGMWVYCLVQSAADDLFYPRIGIITAPINMGGAVTVDLVAPDGTTSLANVQLHHSHVRQALHQEIPVSRRGASRKFWTQAGYL